MPDLNKQYEAKLLRQIAAKARTIRGIYDQAIIQISLYSSSINIQGVEFNLDNYPGLKSKLESVINQMHTSISTTILKSIKDSWDLSNEKNDKISDDILEGRKLDATVKDLIYNPNKEALDAFVKRVEKGMNLSDRVWNLVEPYKYELEAGVADGINKGKSAASMATDMKRYLKDPDKLFRRVRDENGKLKLSKAARNYHPGQGVYKSSYQNALRLTGTETNISYRRADSERWDSQPFTKGIEVRTSPNNHPEYDICDEMKGEYPKDFVFTGWHPRCRCHAIPILATAEEMDKLEDELLGISDGKTVLEQVKDIPAGAKKWVKSNAERINGWKSKPYWVQDNKKHLATFFKKKKA